MPGKKIPRRKVTEANLTYGEKTNVVFVDRQPLLQRLWRSYRWELELECGHSREMTIGHALNVTPKEARCRKCPKE